MTLSHWQKGAASKEQGQIWISHLFKKKLTRAKAGQKTREKRAKKEATMISSLLIFIALALNSCSVF